jgi:hypothetical protein
MNWGDWIREGLELEPIGEAMTVLLDQDCRRMYDKNKCSKVRERRKSITPCPTL